jgi:hypothetical protein
MVQEVYFLDQGFVSICLLEDTRGKGHLTTIVGNDEVLIVAIRIPDG